MKTLTFALILFSLTSIASENAFKTNMNIEGDDFTLTHNKGELSLEGKTS